MSRLAGLDADLGTQRAASVPTGDKPDPERVELMASRLLQFTPDETRVFYTSSATTDDERLVMEAASALVGRLPMKTGIGQEMRPLLDLPSGVRHRPGLVVASYFVPSATEWSHTFPRGLVSSWLSRCTAERYGRSLSSRLEAVKERTNERQRTRRDDRNREAEDAEDDRDHPHRERDDDARRRLPPALRKPRSLVGRARWWVVASSRSRMPSRRCPHRRRRRRRHSRDSLTAAQSRIRVARHQSSNGPDLVKDSVASRAGQCHRTRSRRASRDTGGRRACSCSSLICSTITSSCALLRRATWTKADSMARAMSTSDTFARVG